MLRRALLVVVHFLEVGVDDIVIGFWGFAGRRFGAAFARGLLRLVHRFAELHRSLGQAIGLGLDVIGVVALDRFFQVGKRVLDRGLGGGIDLVAMFGHGLLGRMHQRVGLILGLHRFAALFVFAGMGFGVLDHFLDVGVGKTAAGLDADLLLLAGGLVLGG